MSCHSVSESISKRRTLEVDEEKTDSEIPPEVLLRAQRDVQEFFESELPDVSRESMRWVMERMAPGMARSAMKVEAVDEREVEEFLRRLEEELADRIEAVNRMNFSRGHELDKKTYPSVEEMASLVSWIKSLEKGCSLYKKAPEFKERFTALFSSFVAALLLRVKNQALLSRNAQLECLLLRQAEMDKNDFLGEKSLIECHIEALQTKHGQPLLEFRDLLNLSQLPWLSRKPSMTEQEAFRFLAEFV